MNVNICLCTHGFDHVSNHSFSNNDQKFSTKLIQIQATQHRFYVTSSEYWINFRLETQTIQNVTCSFSSWTNLLVLDNDR